VTDIKSFKGTSGKTPKEGRTEVDNEAANCDVKERLQTKVENVKNDYT